MYERANKRFSGFQHINLVQGDSSDALPVILKKIDQASLFWLDAHYPGVNTAKGQLDTPIMSELRQILQHSINSHVILIDDSRLFIG